MRTLDGLCSAASLVCSLSTPRGRRQFSGQGGGFLALAAGACVFAVWASLNSLPRLQLSTVPRSNYVYVKATITSEDNEILKKLNTRQEMTPQLITSKTYVVTTSPHSLAEERQTR